jgi:flagellum-specific ATP synthase
MTPMQHYEAAILRAELCHRVGQVRRVRGLAVEAEGPDVRVGDMCSIHVRGRDAAAIPAEVVGVEPGGVVLMPLGALEGIGAGARVVARGAARTVRVGEGLLGRVIDALGQPLDGLPPPQLTAGEPLDAGTGQVLQKPRIRKVLGTGVRVIDGMLTIGVGQRVGIFAGSGVGKSSLLAAIARQSNAEINVIALIGERGREVREFVEEQLGAEGLARSVVVVATCEQPALLRIRAAHVAVAIAAHFRGRGHEVLLTMDSITRLAMARREVGLAAGEPATSRGYTPSVFAELPRLCERCGTAPGGGAISALFTVLVEGDDLNEPIADCMRSILDGHIVLSRELAQQGHYPPIDVLRSASRLLGDLATETERDTITKAIGHLAVLDRHRELVDLGAYTPGTNAALDAALALEPALFAWLRQDGSPVERADGLARLAQIVQRGAHA